MYQVTRQRENCGKCQSITVTTPEEARRAYDIAVKAGDVFVEVFDMDEDCQLYWHLTPAVHTVY